MTETKPTGFENDIPLDLARAAHSGTSFVPEERAEQERRDYAATLMADWESLSKNADTDQKKSFLVEEFARYRENFKAKYLDYLRARSRCLSTMITGGSNFNVRRNQKANASEHKRSVELREFRERAKHAIFKILRPDLQPIMSGDDDAVERLEAKIAEAEAKQERMKAVNKAHARYAKDPASLDDSGLDDSAKTLIRNYKAPYSWEAHPFVPYQLTNNNANIRRMKDRLEQIKKAKTEPDAQHEGTNARIEDCSEENRIRLFFPGKPSEEIRARLKKAGFRWSPSLGCWQASRNVNSMATAFMLAGVSEPEKKEVV